MFISALRFARITVIILFYFIKFNKSKDSLNSLKEKRNLFYFFLIEGNWWIVDLWLLPPSLKKLISSNYGVVGYRFDAQRLTQSIHQISLQSLQFFIFSLILSLFNQLTLLPQLVFSLQFNKEWAREMKWKRSSAALEWSSLAAEGR